VKNEAIMVVGHNPNLSEFAGRLIADGNREAGVDLKKGAVARVEVNRQSGTLTWCVTPKLLKTLQASAAESVLPKTSRK
jgi:phosphohistidine phosphatase